MTSVSVPDRSEHVASTAGSGTGLTLVHEDGLPKWVAVTDAAMPLLEEVQHDFGEGPCLLAYAEDSGS